MTWNLVYVVGSNIADAMDLTQGERGIVSQAERERPIAWDNEAIFFSAAMFQAAHVSPRAKTCRRRIRFNSRAHPLRFLEGAWQEHSSGFNS
ncbi:hypothetical protein E2C01_087506 [Portunus trituberculatus]|uniref:Uncharacterized protein n=1 Tax=Portunus trituberculatus TaxID=210409 RepID=A0A5B7JGI9_PORTR|nr:hypothetical protein [Portunus trituberculatus]